MGPLCGRKKEIDEQIDRETGRERNTNNETKTEAKKTRVHNFMPGKYIIYFFI